MVSRTRLLWQRESGRLVDEVLLHGIALEAASDNAGCIRFSFTGTDHEIEWRTGAASGFGAEERPYLDVVGLTFGSPLQR